MGFLITRAAIRKCKDVLGRQEVQGWDACFRWECGKGWKDAGTREERRYGIKRRDCLSPALQPHYILSALATSSWKHRLCLLAAYLKCFLGSHSLWSLCEHTCVWAHTELHVGALAHSPLPPLLPYPYWPPLHPLPALFAFEFAVLSIYLLCDLG